MKKWTFFMLLIALLLFGSVIGFNEFKQHKIDEYFANPPEQEYPVTVTTAKADIWVPVIRGMALKDQIRGVTVAYTLVTLPTKGYVLFSWCEPTL